MGRRLPVAQLRQIVEIRVLQRRVAEIAGRVATLNHARARQAVAARLTQQNEEQAGWSAAIGRGDLALGGAWARAVNRSEAELGHLSELASERALAEADALRQVALAQARAETVNHLERDATRRARRQEDDARTAALEHLTLHRGAAS